MGTLPYWEEMIEKSELGKMAKETESMTGRDKAKLDVLGKNVN